MDNNPNAPEVFISGFDSAHCDQTGMVRLTCFSFLGNEKHVNLRLVMSPTTLASTVRFFNELNQTVEKAHAGKRLQ